MAIEVRHQRIGWPALLIGATLIAHALSSKVPSLRAQTCQMGLGAIVATLECAGNSRSNAPPAKQ
jgi:hypothetical protein